MQEELEVGKRTVRRGGVRVFNRVVEQPVEEQVTLREEHVRVDRHPTDRAATEADLRGGEVIEVTEMAEEPVVGKRSRVVEEVTVGKETTSRTETIRDTVRRTDVDVEKLHGGNDYSSDFRNDFQTRLWLEWRELRHVRSVLRVRLSHGIRPTLSRQTMGGCRSRTFAPTTNGSTPTASGSK